MVLGLRMVLEQKNLDDKLQMRSRFLTIWHELCPNYCLQMAMLSCRKTGSCLSHIINIEIPSYSSTSCACLECGAGFAMPTVYRSWGTDIAESTILE